MRKELSEFENPSDFEIKKIFGYFRDGTVSVQFKNGLYGLIHPTASWTRPPHVWIYPHYGSVVCGPIIPDNIPPEVIDAAKKTLSSPGTEFLASPGFAKRYGIK